MGSVKVVFFLSCLSKVNPTVMAFPKNIFNIRLKSLESLPSRVLQIFYQRIRFNAFRVQLYCCCCRSEQMQVMVKESVRVKIIFFIIFTKVSVLFKWSFDFFLPCITGDEISTQQRYTCTRETPE